MRYFHLREEQRIVLVTVLAVLFAYAAMEIHDRYSTTGIASWYGKRFMGRATASGEIFDPEKMTAAHRRLSMGSIVRVTELKNARQVTVRINDRGPYIPGRIIDLSRAAARQLGILERGLAWVRIEVIGKE
ncbi:MAG: septal ring lytic transglycosylase RlpA family protein [Candidatus Omnitrophica bacterium]|nr:septal ring lytic transglycosylase RlpA family protein [Candidatus Omnitrophota bacterium]MDD5574869.1 septal ring lytic transglycosylase RlpA family protein [Candidatus Omnitrophota bacterium]